MSLIKRDRTEALKDTLRQYLGFWIPVLAVVWQLGFFTRQTLITLILMITGILYPVAQFYAIYNSNLYDEINDEH